MPTSRIVLFVILAASGADKAPAASPEGVLRVATCDFPVSADIAANGKWVRDQMREAKQMGADLAHFPEAALSGYAGVDFASFDGYDWDLLRRETDAVLDLARELNLWVALGSAHRLSGGRKPHDCVYLIGPDGKIVDRYDKRFCTGGDLEHYTPGDHAVVAEINGVRCGVLVCYDIRFPELYRDSCKRGVRLMLHSFYNARQPAGTVHAEVMPATAQAHAGMNNMFISLANSCVPRSWPGRFVTPDGLIAGALPPDAPGVMVHLVDPTARYYDASAPYRAAALEGVLHSGEVVDDPRSTDRTGH